MQKRASFLSRLAGGLVAAMMLIASMMVSSLVTVTEARAQDAARPNILVIFGDDIGQTNVSAYTHEINRKRMETIDDETTAYADGMDEHDGDVGKLLNALDDLKIADTLEQQQYTANKPW